MALTPDQIASKWSTNLAGATESIKNGVNAVTVAPGVAAARQADVWAANVAASKDKYKRNVAGVSLQSWQNSMLTKGVERIASGAAAAQPKFSAFVNQLLPHIAQVKATLPARGGLEANIARSAAFQRGMAKFTNTSSGS